MSELCDQYLKNGKRRTHGKHEVLPRGQFHFLTSRAFPQVHRDTHFVQAQPGALVLWDNRLPHYVSDQLAGTDTREVFFHTFLVRFLSINRIYYIKLTNSNQPNVAVNQVYASRQLSQITRNLPPPDFSRGRSTEQADADAQHLRRMTPLQRKLFALEEWEE